MKPLLPCFMFSFALLICNPGTANTQNGPPGPISTGWTEINFDSTQIARISGLEDIAILNIDPRSSNLPTATLEGVCLYSSTGKVRITAEAIDTTIDTTSQLATMVSGNLLTHFSLQLNQLPLFGNPPPELPANITSVTCEDGANKYPLTVTLSEVPKRAGTYQASIRLLVTAI